MEGKHYTKKNIFITIIQIIFIICIICSSIYIIKWIIENKKTKEISTKIEDAVTIMQVDTEEKEEEYNIDFEKLQELNKDVCAWIKVKNTEIEYPIVKTTDNDYYIKHSLDKTRNSAGWPFMDYKNKLDGTDKNIVIYGHNRKDRSMFGSLDTTLKEEWYLNEDNLEIIFITKNGKETYEVFSNYQVLNEDYYITTNFKDNEFTKFIKTIKNRSIHNYRVELSENDSILTLSTCANNNKYRMVLHAKKK